MRILTGQPNLVSAGLGYRFDNFGDAVYPTIEVFYKGLHVGANYDINVSSFNIATRRRAALSFLPGILSTASQALLRYVHLFKECFFPKAAGSPLLKV